MKTKISGLNILTYLCTLVVGILFMILTGKIDLMTLLTRLVGLVFLIPGLLSIISTVGSIRRNEVTRLSGACMSVVAVGAVALGVLMNVFPDFFSRYVAILLGVMLILLGAYQFVLFLRRYNKGTCQWLLTLVPALVVAAGIAIFVVGDKGMTALLWHITGAVLLAFSLNGLIGDYITGATGKDDVADGEPRQVRIE